MTILTARRLETRYRFEGPVSDGQSRLDAVLRQAVTGSPMETALVRAGLDGPEIVCLRRVDSRVQLSLRYSNAGLAEQWSEALALAIREAAGQRESAVLVRYRSRAHALTDLARRALTGDLTRAWAWWQLGLWPEQAPGGSQPVAQAVAAALGAEPKLIVPVLGTLAESHLLEILVRDLALVADWETLAEAAWAAVTGGARPPSFSAPPDEVAFFAEPAPAWPAEWSQVVLVRALHQAACRCRVSGPPRAMLFRAWAMLAGLAVAPGAAASSSPLAVQTILRYWEAAPPFSAVPPALQPETKPVTAVIDEQPVVPPRPAARSRFGGLLYLLNTVAELDLVREWLRPDWTRGMAWTMHRLALRLTPAAADDPAALAFAGLAPEAEPPGRFPVPPESDGEAQRLDEWKERLESYLETSLERLPQRGPALLRFVCDRPCVILADPGWLEVRLRLEDVSVDIRRARLDLNPGYLPWLGTTVVFVYE